jgi:thioredoxin 1
VQTVTSAVAHETIAATPGVILVDVTAAWCPPCKAITPLLRQMHADTEGLTVLAVDAETDPGFVAEFEVMSFPTLLFFNDGTLVHRLTGARGLAALREEVARVKASVGLPQ